LANAIHVSRSSIAKWEQGRGYPTEESIQDLCNFFKIDRENLIDDDKEILKNYYAHEKRKRRLWIFASATAILVIAGGITGRVWYYQANNYSNAPSGKLTNSLQSQCFLAEIGKAFPLSKIMLFLMKAASLSAELIFQATIPQAITPSRIAT
jgi:transcriptional regulator with XRE-family HTH domain